MPSSLTDAELAAVRQMVAWHARNLAWSSEMPEQMADLIGVGNLAAIESLPRFDPTKGTVTTYLRHRVRGEMISYLRKTLRL